MSAINMVMGISLRRRLNSSFEYLCGILISFLWQAKFRHGFVYEADADLLEAF
jgi:hypothetical protein